MYVQLFNDLLNDVLYDYFARSGIRHSLLKQGRKNLKHLLINPCR